jgi:hypothetical protein
MMCEGLLTGGNPDIELRTLKGGFALSATLAAKFCCDAQRTLPQMVW